MKICLSLLCILLFLTACGPAERDPEPAGPLELESLSVEVSRGALSTEALAQAVRELPEALKAALADQGVEAETVTVSAGSSPAAIAQAVREGGVDVAFLPAEDFDALEDPPRLLLTAGDEEEGAMAAIVRSDSGAPLEGETFALALAAAVNALREDQPVFGPCDYVRAVPE